MNKERMIEKIKNKILADKENLLYHQTQSKYYEQVIELYEKRLKKLND